MRYLLLLLIVIPAMEIGILILSGQIIGIWSTVLLIVLTGIIGAYLAKKEGLETLRRAQHDMEYGRLPGEAIIDGICVLIGAVLLLTPGFITDITGFFMLFSYTRKPLKKAIMKGLKKWMERSTITIIR